MARPRGARSLFARIRMRWEKVMSNAVQFKNGSRGKRSPDFMQPLLDGLLGWNDFNLGCLKNVIRTSAGSRNAQSKGICPRIEAKIGYGDSHRVSSRQEAVNRT